MPLFEYTCKRCDSDFELLVRGDEQPQCPQCGGHRLEKHLSVPAAHSAGAKSLPVCGGMPGPGGCGYPQCGMGGCGLE